MTKSAHHPRSSFPSLSTLLFFPIIHLLLFRLLLLLSCCSRHFGTIRSCCSFTFSSKKESFPCIIWNMICPTLFTLSYPSSLFSSKKTTPFAIMQVLMLGRLFGWFIGWLIGRSVSWSFVLSLTHLNSSRFRAIQSAQLHETDFAVWRYSRYSIWFSFFPHFWSIFFCSFFLAIFLPLLPHYWVLRTSENDINALLCKIHLTPLFVLVQKSNYI